MPHSSGTTYENPVIVDVDGDNNAEIVMASNNYAFPGEAGIRVFRDRLDGWVNTRHLEPARLLRHQRQRRRHDPRAPGDELADGRA